MSENETFKDHFDFVAFADATMNDASPENDLDYLQKCMNSLASKDSEVHLSSSESIEIPDSGGDLVNLENASCFQDIFEESNEMKTSEEQLQLLENEMSLLEQEYANSSDLDIREGNILNDVDLIASDDVKTIESNVETPQNECTECSMTFRYKRHYDRHMEGHKKNDCVHCNAKFARRKHLDVHLYRIHGETSHRYVHSCEVCERSFPKRSLLNRHRSKHHYEEGKICPDCGEIAKSDAELEEHRQRHDGEKLYKCSRCPRAFRIKRTYVIHVQNHDNYKCPTCVETFSSKKAVNEHLKTAHNLWNKRSGGKSSDEAGPYFCKDCRQVFIKKSSYCRHLETALHLSRTNEEMTVKAIFTCPVCSKTLTSRQACVQHVRRVHRGEKKFVCVHCSAKFAYRNDLARHKQLHVEERNVICEYCGKTFTSLSILKDHVLYVHNKERHFVCEECGRSFKRNSLLNRHKLSHQQVRPFSCQHCNAAFKRSHHLTRHMESCHRLTMEKKKRVVKLMKAEDGSLVPIPEKVKKVSTAIPETKKQTCLEKNSSETLKKETLTKTLPSKSELDKVDETAEVGNISPDETTQVLSLVDVKSGQVVTVHVTDRDSSSMNALVDQFEANCNEMFGLANFPQNVELKNNILQLDQNCFNPEFYSELEGTDASLLLDSESSGKLDVLSTMEHYPSQSLLSYLNV